MRITDGLASPLRIAIDERDDVYVTDAIGGRISRYDSAGNFLGQSIAGHSPLAITVTPQHQLYVGDRISGELLLLNAEGQFLKKIADGFGLPSSAVIDDENRLYVVDSKKKSVHIFDANGNPLSSFGESILFFPTGIAFDQRNQRILVAEHGGLNYTDTVHLIHVFDKQGRWLTSFGKHGFNKGEFTRIQGMAVGPEGRIYVADPFQGVVTVLNENGTFLTTVGQFGSEPGQLRAPMDVAIDPRGRLWVSSMNNGSLEVYEHDIEDSPTAVQDNRTPALPSRSELLQNYPNPFNPSTWIPFVLGKESHVVIHIYNDMGQLVRTFDLGTRKPGSYISEGRAVYWDGMNSQGESVASGVYLCEIRTDNVVAVRRMLLIK